MSVPATEYVVVNKQNTGRTGSQQQGPTLGQRSQAAQSQIAKVPAGLPRFLGDRRIIFASWGVSMILVGFDEWHNYHMLPRPSRFWYTSLTFGLLMLASLADAIVPLVNALAIGYTIMLLWQYYNGAGQFKQGA